MIQVSQRGKDITPIGKTSAETFHEPEEEEVNKIKEIENYNFCLQEIFNSDL